MLIELDNVNKSYPIGDTGFSKKVLDGISMKISKGETLSIMGPSGSGKSTLLNIIGTLDTPDNGNIIYGEKSLNGLSEKELTNFRNQKIGFIFQMHHLLPQCSVLENILIPTLPLVNKALKEESHSRAVKLIKDVGLWDQKDMLPGRLSGGECQRVAVIRAMINKPQILLADEPTGSLDRENAQSITSLLLQMNQDYETSLIVVTHSQEIGSKMGTSYNLIDGKIEQLK